MAEKRGRITWIDVAKGIGIVLVSFGHLPNGDGQSVWLPALAVPIWVIYLFHMPFFYFLGGFTLNSNKPFGQFLRRRVLTLLVPYYIFSLYFLAKPVAMLLKGSLATTFRSAHDYDLGWQVVDVFIMGNGLWFLWAFFIGEVITYALSRLIYRKPLLALTGIAFILIYSLYTMFIPTIPIPLQIPRGIQAAGYMLLALSLRSWVKELTMPRIAPITLGCLMVFACVVIVLSNANGNGTVSLLLQVIAATAGTFACTGLAMAINSNTILEYIGRGSLVFYALNALTLNVAKLFFFRVLRIKAWDVSWPLQTVIGLAVIAFSLVLLALENEIVHKWLWWAIGAQRPVRVVRQTPATEDQG